MVDDADDPFAGAGVTALGLAAARAVESTRPDRLIEDALAGTLFAAAGRALPMRVRWPAPEETVSDTEALHLHGSRYIGLRTRVYDDVLLLGAERGIRQAVLLGSGLDTRAYRLRLGGEVRIFELDRPSLLAWKRRVLAEAGAFPSCRLVDVGVDLHEDPTGSLERAGFDPGAPSVIVAEGLLAYLTPAAQARLLERVTRLAAPGSRLSLDHLLGDPQAEGAVAGLSRRAGIAMDSLITSSRGFDPVAALSAEGWRVRQERVERTAARLGRDLRDPFGGSGPPPWLETAFLHAGR